MELLAPAGNLNKLKYAFAYGADAVYCGIPDFSLRVRVNQFGKEDLAKGIAYAHRKNKKVYVTLNIYPHNQKLDQLKKYLPRLIKIKPDAIIVSDPGILSLIRKKYPRQEIHLSTQANALNYGAVQFWKKQGVKRIILARETTLKEAAQIKKQVPQIKLEYFAHGAMCMAYSGRCLLSAWLNRRSANEGDCTQPCRWPWLLTETPKPCKGRQRNKSSKNTQNHTSRTALLEEDQHGTYFLNSKDLCLIEHLSQIERSGIDCLKIEGRNKSLYYLATVVKYYSEALNSQGEKRKQVIKEALQEFRKLGNRQYTTGFAFGPDSQIQNFSNSRNQSRYQMVGEYLGNDPKRPQLFRIFVHNSFKNQEALEAISPYGLRKVKVTAAYNHKRKACASAHGGTDKIWYIKFNKPLPAWSILRNKIKK